MSLSYLKMPDVVILEETSQDKTYGRFTVQPLERGYGVTLGNSFRRVLLSSLTGAAITGVRLDGILHEFSTIPGVLEDITEIVLNLKKVRLKILNKKTSKLDVTLVGPCKFTAADLQSASADIEILNPDIHIATLNADAKVSMEVRYGSGKGYVPSFEQQFTDQNIGLIPIDAIFTPIVNVKYDISNVRIGEKNDFEKLSLEIKTDGSITPEEALTSSAIILRDHVNLFINFEVEIEEEKQEVKRDTEFDRLRSILLLGVDDLELSVRAHNCLKAANIKILGDLVRRDESELLRFRNFGRKSLAELIEIVDTYGLEFGMDVDKYIKDKPENQ
ncbi:MAG: DNA-directed RNA polymerase subunit alpha [Ignavibacteriales bacterium]|nr:DNA-directed RNA polymerase subunit alpha [Ignavibacteriales bacterium]MCF8315677.1 DNA-directed RNA polymerase subunit alpha [Ignavibacteriales bacterium]MCF8437129.1 DNA-directed RNA polymerase subunit alpha [Ignavibacteriales bacterium]